jgi:hypothetical protein
MMGDQPTHRRATSGSTRKRGIDRCDPPRHNLPDELGDPAANPATTDPGIRYQIRELARLATHTEHSADHHRRERLKHR